MELQVFTASIAFRLPIPYITKSGERTQIILTTKNGEKTTILDTDIPLVFDSLVLIDVVNSKVKKSS